MGELIGNWGKRASDACAASVLAVTFGIQKSMPWPVAT